MNSRVKLLGIVALVVLVAGISAASAFGATNFFRNGLNYIDPDQVTPGYVVYSAQDGKVYIVNIHGQVAKKITSQDGTFAYTRPLDNGNLLARFVPTEGRTRIVEMDQDGTFLWEFEEPVGTSFHHDHSRLENGNTLILCVRDIVVPEISPDLIEDDCLLEVDPDGNIVWDWQTADHYDDFGFDQQWLDAISDHAGDWAHANAAAAIPGSSPHADPALDPGNVIISYRFINRSVIVDRNSGDIVWQSDLYQTVGQHDSHMIRGGYPGGGNILVFDNGFGGHYNFGGPEVSRYYSRIVEIDPITKEIPWQYDAGKSGQVRSMFNSWFISSVQRLPNGNTFIDEGAFGRLFEVTTDGEIVWEFINPILGPFPGPGGGESNRVYRAEKVGLGWLQ